jgi:hypothetical protein
MGGGMHHASPMDGGVAKGAALGTGDPIVDQEDRKAARMISSICRGC